MYNAPLIPLIYGIPVKTKKTQNHKKYESLFLRKYKHILEEQNILNNCRRLLYHQAQNKTTSLRKKEYHWSKSDLSNSMTVEKANLPNTWSHADSKETLMKGENNGIKCVTTKGTNNKH